MLLAHSYGSTTYGITAAERGLSADSVYLIGSIGTNQESAHGFLYFESGFQRGMRLYLTGLEEAATGKELFFVEIPLE